MIEIESYLRHPDGLFENLRDASTRPPNPQYIEGAVCLTINSVEIIDREHWDYVDDLWAYIADMVCRFSAKDEVHTLFPDQPIKLTIKRIPGRRAFVSLSYDDMKRSATAPEEELVHALQSSGEWFFRRMKKLLPENSPGYDDALERLYRYQLGT